MWKRIIIYVIVLAILLGLYLLFTPQSLQSSSKNSTQEIQNTTQPGFKGPAGAPSAKGPNSQPPN